MQISWRPNTREESVVPSSNRIQPTSYFYHEKICRKASMDSIKNTETEMVMMIMPVLVMECRTFVSYRTVHPMLVRNHPFIKNPARQLASALQTHHLDMETTWSQRADIRVIYIILIVLTWMRRRMLHLWQKLKRFLGLFRNILTGFWFIWQLQNDIKLKRTRNLVTARVRL